VKSFFSFLKEEESTLDTTIWSTENNSGSLRELLDSTKDSSVVRPVEISDLLPKTTKWDGDKSEWNRVKQVNLDHPITVIHKEGEVHAIADGHHRIHSANSLGRTHINANIIDFEMLPDKFKEIFG